MTTDNKVSKAIKMLAKRGLTLYFANENDLQIRKDNILIIGLTLNDINDDQNILTVITAFCAGFDFNINKGR